MMKICILACILAILVSILSVPVLSGQQQETATPEEEEAAKAKAEKEKAEKEKAEKEKAEKEKSLEGKAEPYVDEEFPGWAHDLRRAEIIMAGVFPFSLFVSSFGYDLVRFATNGFNAAYSPWPFKQPGAPELEQSEQIGILIMAISLSGVIALADYFLGLKKAEQE